MESRAGIWRVGILLEASYLPQLKESPMRLIRPITETLSGGGSVSAGVVTVCKIGKLNTYQYANEYITPSSAGCVLHAVDQFSGHYPSMLAVPLIDKCLDCEEILKSLGLSLKDLHIVTGLPQSSEPTILLASQHFMESYGFFTREQVWFRWYCPTPLEQVMLTTETLVQHTSADIENVVVQLYEKSEQECVLMHQGFNFVFRAKLAIQEVVLIIRAVDCSPVLQGQITSDTMITFLPPTSLSSNGSFFSRRRRSTREDTRLHPESAASATDVHPECEENSSSRGYRVEAISVPSYRLPSQYIVLPKETATKHQIFHCQNVWIESAEQEDDQLASSLSDVTLSLFTSDKKTGKRGHVAVAFLYEEECELEQYVPPFLLGSEYDTAALTVAYLHPEMLFFLFPETLSPLRHYFVNIMRAKITLPKIKMLHLAEVLNPAAAQEAQPELTLDHNHSVLEHFNGRSVLLSNNEVFKVVSGSGRSHYYKVCSLGPNCDSAGSLDANTSTSWDCNIQTSKVHSYVPDIVPPSSVFPNPLLFDSISPPGLTEYSDVLFSFFLPAFRAINSTKPHRCPSVLIHGPPGVGKRTVIQAVARRCRMHVIELNCHEFTSDTAPFAEKKFMTDMDHATSFDPVVIVLFNVHMLGRKNTTHEEPRISAFFEVYMKEVNSFNRNSDFPIIVVGVTCKVAEVPSRVQACFLQQLELQPPTQTQRLSMLQSLSYSYHLGPEVDLTKLSQSTAGSVFGDLVNIFIQAYDLAVSATIKYCADKITCRQEDVTISGVVIKQEHLDTVLAALHSRRSDSIGAPKIPNVKWEDVGGLVEAKQEILDTIQLPLHYPDLFSSNLRRSGVLLYGAPGTGKTLLAKAVATECSLNFLSVKGPEVINMYVGQSEENIREVFGRARRCAPCVIFFDELDSIAPNRGRSGDSGGVMDRVVSQLLAELDGLHKAQDVFIIGATNRPDLIDPALLRPGRFDRLVYLGMNEDAAAKEKILKAITRKFQLSADVDLTEVAKRCPATLTGADLYALCSDSMLSALRRCIASSEGTQDCILEVEQSDFMAALSSLKPSISPEELLKYNNIQAKIST